MCIFGPTALPESIACLISRSAYGSTLPVVRIDVTPPPRYSFGKLDACSGYIPSFAPAFTRGAG